MKKHIIERKTKHGRWGIVMEINHADTEEVKKLFNMIQQEEREGLNRSYRLIYPAKTRTAVVYRAPRNLESVINWLQCRHYTDYSEYEGLWHSEKRSDVEPTCPMDRKGLKGYGVFKISTWPHKTLIKSKK